jgi:hypothetical protein
MRATNIQPQGCTNFKLRQLLRTVSRHYDAELAHAGLKGTQFSLLSHVVKLGPLQPQALCPLIDDSDSSIWLGPILCTSTMPETLLCVSHKTRHETKCDKSRIGPVDHGIL